MGWLFTYEPRPYSLFRIEFGNLISGPKSYRGLLLAAMEG